MKIYYNSREDHFFKKQLYKKACHVLQFSKLNIIRTTNPETDNFLSKKTSSIMIQNIVCSNDIMLLETNLPKFPNALSISKISLAIPLKSIQKIEFTCSNDLEFQNPIIKCALAGGLIVGSLGSVLLSHPIGSLRFILSFGIGSTIGALYGLTQVLNSHADS